MRQTVCPLAARVIAAMLSSCASGFYHVQTAMRFRYPSIDLYGKYASQWTVDDVRQIVELARSRSDIKKPIEQIEIDRPDHANVKSGNPQNQGDPLTTFEVHRQNGRWIIIKGTVSTGPAVITS